MKESSIQYYLNSPIKPQGICQLDTSKEKVPRMQLNQITKPPPLAHTDTHWTIEPIQPGNASGSPKTSWNEFQGSGTLE